MEIIKDIEEVKGKTIKYFGHYENGIWFKFTDGSYVFLYASIDYGGDREMEVWPSPDSCTLASSGAISEEAYNYIKNKLREEENIRSKERDLKELKRLREKYENN